MSRRAVLYLTVMTLVLAVMALASCGSGGSQEAKKRADSTPTIAFMKQDAEGFEQTWVANADLSDQVKLTSEPADSGWAVWKPGGGKLAFESNRADPDTTDSDEINEVFTMNPDGSAVAKLTNSKGYSGTLGWSPDGTKIAFDSDLGQHPQKQGIYVMDADGSNVRRVTTLPENKEYDTAPRFSPDGKRIVFTRYITDPGVAALFTVGVDGSGLKQLTPWDNGAGDAHWSPDGTQIVFEAHPSPDSYGEIFTIDADNGQQLTNLTNNQRSGGGSADPVWSPDGKKILFLSEHFFSGESGIGLATMTPDGTDRHFISPNPVEMHQPDWEPAP